MKLILFPIVLSMLVLPHSFAGRIRKNNNEKVLSQVLEGVFRKRDHTVISTFFEIAKIPRISEHEEKIRRWLINIADPVNLRMEKNVIQYQVDPIGNILFTLEGTGRFAGQTVPVSTLQGHMDMIWAVSNVGPETPIGPFFENGVSLAYENGWLKSGVVNVDGVSHKTTIGADNGMGMAMALRYMIDFEEEHPPLALLFTVGEEQGMRGVKNVKLPLIAPYLINIDSFHADKFTYGCLGNSRAWAETPFNTVPVSDESNLLTLKIAGLRGGHSGADIHRPRLNAILTAIHLAKGINDSNPGQIRILSFNGGDQDALNKIPTYAEIVLVIPTGLVTNATDMINQTFNQMVQNATDETNANLSISSIPSTGVRSLNNAQTLQFLKTLLAVKNGAVSYREDSPNGVNTSSNLGYLGLQPSTEGTALIARTGYMARSYEKSLLDEIINSNQQSLSQWNLEPNTVKLNIQTYTTPWISDPNGPFYSKMKELAPHYKTILSGGTN